MSSLQRLPLSVSAVLLAAVAGCASATPPAAPRSAAPPVESSRVEAANPAPAANPGSPLIAFLGLGRGDRMADLGSGRGYSIASFSEAVGPFGIVYVRHDPRTLQSLSGDAERGRPAEPTEPLPDNVLPMATPVEAPLVATAKDLDLVTFLFGYQELIVQKRDRKPFHTAVLHALKPAGLYVIAEHGAAPGAGPSAAPGPGRIDARSVQAEVEAAGFRFVEAADFLSLALVERAAVAQRQPQSSQYILKFQKPR